MHSLAGCRYSSLALCRRRTAPSLPSIRPHGGEGPHLPLRLFHFSHYFFSTNRTKTTSAKQRFYPQAIHHQRWKTAPGKGDTESPSPQGPALKPRASRVTETHRSTGGIPVRPTRNCQKSWCEDTRALPPLKRERTALRITNTSNHLSFLWCTPSVLRSTPDPANGGPQQRPAL